MSGSVGETKSQRLPFLPLTGEVARAQRVTEGENLLAVRRTARNTRFILTCLSPSLDAASAVSTAPSSEGAKGAVRIQKSEIRCQNA